MDTSSAKIITGKRLTAAVFKKFIDLNIFSYLRDNCTLNKITETSAMPVTPEAANGAESTNLENSNSKDNPGKRKASNSAQTSVHSKKSASRLLESQSEKLDLIVNDESPNLLDPKAHILRIQSQQQLHSPSQIMGLGQGQVVMQQQQQQPQPQQQTGPLSSQTPSLIQAHDRHSSTSDHVATIEPDRTPSEQIPSSSQSQPQTNATTTHTAPVVKKTVLEEHGFIIGKQIGSGTYAKVKIAHSTEFKGPVAVKIISKIKAPHEYLTKFLPREIDVVRGLRHENLIRFYQSIETTHRVYIIMQFAEKGSMLDLIRQNGYLSETNSRKYFQQLTSAIEYCHSQGVVHRDIKCENLLLDKDFNLKLIDFGFARKNMKPVNNKAVLSDTYCGSYAYASPEVLKGTPYDPQMSDIWATGVVLFAMVFGRLPYDGSNYQQLLKQVQAKLVFPRTPNVPQSCKALLGKVLAPLKVRINIRVIRQDQWFCQRD